VAITTQEPPPPGVQPHPFAQDVWLVNPDGSNLRRLTELADNQPSIDWSADGATIYALGATGFWRIDAATGAREPVGFAAALGQIRWLDR
jgi:Tol biopolymer transport system component